MTPSISVVCCTYGRTKFLPETLAMFAAQDYQGERELILLNSFPQQKYSCTVPNVKIINLDARPSSLGNCRNEAIKAAKGDILVQLDSDDYILPHFLSSVAKHFKPGLSWIWFQTQFFSEKGKIKKLMPGNISSLAYAKAAWEKVGGFEPLTVGEDRSFIGKLTTQCEGTVIRIEPHEIGFIYGWDNEAGHISGLGPDERRSPSSHIWAQEELESRIKSGNEPVGEIVLVPKLIHDWPSIVSDFLSKNYGVITKKKVAVCIVQLGGVGEIVNILPILKHIDDNYAKPYLMVSKSCASILDGVSYVNPVIVDLPVLELNKALDIARKEFQFVLCGQTSGKNHAQVQNCKSYNMESWRNLGFENKFEDRTWMPLFDKFKIPKNDDPSAIDKFRGNTLICLSNSVIKSDTGGFLIEKWTDDFLVIPLDVIQRFNLITKEVFDCAACLVTNEPDALHLAAASNVPVVAIVESHPWFTISPRCNCVSLLTREQIAKSPEDLIISIKAAVASSFPPVSVSPAVVAPKRRVWHAVDIRDTSKLKDKDRIQAAQYSWESLYQQGVIPAHYTEKKRTADKTIGDSRALVYLKDVLENAMVKMDDSDICIWTNDDVWLHPQLADLIRFHVSVYGACTSSRREFMKGFPEPFDHTPEQIAKLGNRHIGRDLFAATKEWLVAHWDEIPDGILGSTVFDLHLGYLCRIDKGIRFDQGTLEQHVWPAEIPEGYLAHEHHFPAWANDPNNSPSQRHNKAIYDKFWAENKHKLEPI